MSVFRVGALALVTLLVVSCASAPPDPRIAQMEARLESFVSNAEFAAYGGEELQRAEAAVRRLSSAKLDTEELEEALYGAGRLIDTAEYAARSRIADDRREELVKERERLVLMARTREAERAQRLAEQARAEAAAAVQIRESALREARVAESAALAAKAEADAAKAEADAAKAEAEAARLEMEDMRNRLAELEARPTDRGLLLTLGDVLFAFNQADLKAGVERTLMPLAEVLKDKPEQTVIVEGHTDSVGSREYNMLLSERRAEAVREFLVEQGVEAERISVEGLGPDFPIAENSDEAGRQRNRRVDVILPNVETVEAR